MSGTDVEETKTTVPKKLFDLMFPATDSKKRKR
jgi:hypothetical protein